MIESLEKIMDEISSIEKRREEILKGNRDVLMYCRKAIVSTHLTKMEEALHYIELAEKKHKELKEYAKDDLYYYLIAAEVEIVEAKALYAIYIDSRLPSYDEMNVKGSSYILGLLDCIGEMKRIVLDLLRSDRYERAQDIFRKMEEMYSALIQFAAYDNIIQGVRKKLDQDRMIVESVREVITEESRRKIFLNELRDAI
ncbi:MAG: hypothetical protein QW416_01295 [Candidatus Nitrosocaldaceae archaeon]